MPAKLVFQLARMIWLFQSKKHDHIAHSFDKVKKLEKQYRDGLITAGERYNKVVDEWTSCTANFS